MIGRGAGAEVWVSGFKWMRSFCSLSVSQTADVTRWEWILSLFWFPSCIPLLSPSLSWENLKSAKTLDSRSFYRQQTHTLPPLKLSYPRVESLVYNRLKYKHVFSPIHLPTRLLRKPYVIKSLGRQHNLQQVGFNWPSWGVAEVGFKRYWPYGFVIGVCEVGCKT